MFFFISFKFVPKFDLIAEQTTKVEFGFIVLFNLAIAFDFVRSICFDEIPLIINLFFFFNFF